MLSQRSRVKYSHASERHFHDKVRNALIKDGWTITDDPYSLKWDDNEKLYIDLAAERLLAAQKGSEKIAVEIKTFIGKSTMYDLHLAVGQFVVYRTAIEISIKKEALILTKKTWTIRETWHSLSNVKNNLRCNQMSSGAPLI